MLLHPSAQQDMLTQVLESQVTPGNLDDVMSYNSLTTYPTLILVFISVRSYDNTAMCGLVWTADFVAFRCRTCGISQCMSLCADCFKDGNHEGHDFNMFKSQAGGACDCGDSSVMRESG